MILIIIVHDLLQLLWVEYYWREEKKINPTFVFNNEDFSVELCSPASSFVHLEPQTYKAESQNFLDAVLAKPES